MAKLDLNEVTREELVDIAGLRPFVAEAVLKARDEHGSEIADIGALKDALSEVKGIGPATLDQLGDHLAVRRKPAKPVSEKAADAPMSAAKVGAEEVRQTGEKATDTPASGVKIARQVAAEPTEAAAPATKAGAEEVRRTVEKAAEVTSLVARRGVEAASRTVSGLVDAEKATAQRSSEVVSGLSQLVARLINEQVRANVETLQALARARTWREALEVQGEFFRGNVGRMSEGTSRYVETVTRLATGLAEVGRGKGKTTA